MDNQSTVYLESINQEVSIEYSNRKNLGIAVTPDKRVKVRAPLNTSIIDVHNRLIKRVTWIYKQLKYFDQFEPKKEKNYFSGESHYYLGRQYRLKLEKSEFESVTLQRGKIIVSLNDPSDTVRAKYLLEAWYLEKAKQKLSERLNFCISKFRGLEIQSLSLAVKKLKTKWGSCFGNKITLNSVLIKAPVHCIDYVIVHELCHLKYPNHGKDFYKLLNKNIDNWEKLKVKLEDYI